jgi:hypothetical protein
VESDARTRWFAVLLGPGLDTDETPSAASGRPAPVGDTLAKPDGATPTAGKDSA